MMRVLMECMYPKEVKGSELVQAILQWEMKWNAELGHDRREVLLDEGEGGHGEPQMQRKKEGGAVLMDFYHRGKEADAKKTREKNVTSTSGWMWSTRRRGATFVRGTVTWPVNAPRRAKVREGQKVEERE